MIFNPFRWAAFLAAFLPLGVYGYDLSPTLGIIVLFLCYGLGLGQHFHLLRALHALLSGVFEQFMLCFFKIPRLRAQKDRFLGPPSGCGLFKLLPVFRL